MNIYYANVPVFLGEASSWLPGTVVPAPNGFAIQPPDGAGYVTFNPDGSYSVSPTIGSYETITFDPSLQLFHVDSAVPNHPDMHLTIAWKAR